jgi:hypothetical protein
MRSPVIRLAQAFLTATFTAGACLAPCLTGCTINGIKYQVLVDREFGTQPVLESATFRSGEKFRLRITPDQDCHMYLLNQGSSGKHVVLFPIPQINDGSNLLAAHRTIEIPPRGSYQFDPRAGLERLVMCVSRRPHPRLEELARSGFPDAAAVEALLVDLEHASQRKSSFVKTLSCDATGVCFVTRDPEAVLVCRITLRHEPAETSRHHDEPFTPLCSGQRPAGLPTARVPTETSRTNSSDVNHAIGGEHPARNAEATSASPAVSPGSAATTAAAQTGRTHGDTTWPERLISRMSSEEMPHVVSLDQAIDQGWVQIRVTGNGLSSVRLHAACCHQPGPRVSVCADIDRPAPNAQSVFAVSRVRDPRLGKLLQVIERRRPSQVAAQVAVWAVVDDVSRRQLNQTFRRTRHVGGVQAHSGPAATDTDIAAAKSLVEEAGLSSRDFQLFR